MTNSASEFNRITNTFTTMNTDVRLGKMMSSPGLTCNGKVFAFLGKGGMGFRLGWEFDPDAFGLRNPKPLNPFKTKPPLKGWYIVEKAERGKWEALATQALAFTRTL